MAKRIAVVDKKRCAACGACLSACPKGAVSVHKGCYAVISADVCVGCGKCEKVGPAGCITVKERETNEA
ncbi:MAG: 4Fe-4S binding protein [Clostridia bacterium]|nr:4Fe-4S binding protein [Clostridia bacterium]